MVIRKKESTYIPRYYAILPPKIKNNKELSYLEKLVFCEICGVAINQHFKTREKPYCNKDDTYFSQLFEYPEKSIKTMIFNLHKKGKICVVEVWHGRDKERQIYVNSKELHDTFFPPSPRQLLLTE